MFYCVYVMYSSGCIHHLAYTGAAGAADSFLGRQPVYYLAAGVNSMAGRQPDMPK